MMSPKRAPQRCCEACSASSFHARRSQRQRREANTELNSKPLGKRLRVRQFFRCFRLHSGTKQTTTASRFTLMGHISKASRFLWRFGNVFRSQLVAWFALLPSFCSSPAVMRWRLAALHWQSCQFCWRLLLSMSCQAQTPLGFPRSSVFFWFLVLRLMSFFGIPMHGEILPIITHQTWTGLHGHICRRGRARWPLPLRAASLLSRIWHRLPDTCERSVCLCRSVHYSVGSPYLQYMCPYAWWTNGTAECVVHQAGVDVVPGHQVKARSPCEALDSPASCPEPYTNGERPCA
mmetsp:Transcript_4954/g.13833  ORF Transcript_4954/g.13833 Transcript_4954/m.13833 type:complete len:291 (+) Transcript_4954:758-1630(+)